MNVFYLLATDSILPHVNASLNCLAAVLLVIGYLLIKNRKETAHKITMISSFGVSIAFLTCYLIYHFGYDPAGFPRDRYPVISILYYLMLFSHIVLATIVPVLAITTIILGLRDKRTHHRRWARITFPIWLYVSITGVLVYLCLYWWFLPEK
jgi:uncharacterized membrane protein YozB (DUF420 family)